MGVTVTIYYRDTSASAVLIDDAAAATWAGTYLTHMMTKHGIDDGTRIVVTISK